MAEIKEQVATELEKRVNLNKEVVETQKALHGKLLHVKVVTDAGDELHFYFKTNFKGKRNLLELANNNLLENRNLDSYNETILVNTVLNGVDVIRENEEVFLALAPCVDKIVKSATTALEKL